MKEGLKQRQAYEDWIALGEGRSLGKLAAISPCSKPTLSRWSIEFGWQKRLKRMKEADKDRVSKHLVRRSDDDTVKEVETLLGRISTAIDDCFKLDEKTDRLKPTFKVVYVSDFIKLVNVQKDLILLHKELTELEKGAGNTPKLNKIAETLNVFLGNMTDGQKIALLTGSPVKGGTARDTGDVSEADYTEVSDDTAEDSDGCSDVSCSDG